MHIKGIIINYINVRFKIFKKIIIYGERTARFGLGTHETKIHRLKRINHLKPQILIKYRSGSAFDLLDGNIIPYRDHQNIALSFAVLKKKRVSRVRKVKSSGTKYDGFIPKALAYFWQFGAADNRHICDIKRRNGIPRFL